MLNDASNLASFYCSHIDGIICVKQIGLGLNLFKLRWQIISITLLVAPPPFGFSNLPTALKFIRWKWAVPWGRYATGGIQKWRKFFFITPTGILIFFSKYYNNMTIPCFMLYNLFMTSRKRNHQFTNLKCCKMSLKAFKVKRGQEFGKFAVRIRFPLVTYVKDILLWSTKTNGNRVITFVS